MGRAIIWMVMLLVLLGLFCAVVGTIIAVVSSAGKPSAERRRQEKLETERLEQERIEFLRRNGGDF